MEILEFFSEYGMEIFKAIFTIVSMFLAWRSGKKSGSAKLMKDIQKLEDINKKYTNKKE